MRIPLPLLSTALLLLAILLPSRALACPGGFSTATCHDVCATVNGAEPWDYDCNLSVIDGTNSTLLYACTPGGTGFMAYGSLQDGATLFCCEYHPGDDVGNVSIWGSDTADEIRLNCPQISQNLTASATYAHGYASDCSDDCQADTDSDVIWGSRDSSCVDYLYGGDGNDFLYGGEGNDFLDGGDDDDTLSGGDGSDTIEGGGANDWLYGGDGPDTIVGGFGYDYIWGEAGVDYLYGDFISGEGTCTGDCFDWIKGGSENDYIYGGEGADELCGETGTDTLYGGDDIDKLYGGAENDAIIDGGGGDDDCENDDPVSCYTTTRTTCSW